ncbi:hypothetical protein [Nannocystis punicea]|uniref:Uncharacterized protein n=1 Tax=Nannocystis punicea TaxID=2995304 RepID=A0ABY7H227_9BACT|nr:hypothetical protein [Nannocystis poenicansa]WAS93291.1 hypothetical protein O0S08_44670 [Nannocystis poenicansa]
MQALADGHEVALGPATLELVEVRGARTGPGYLPGRHELTFVHVPSPA